MMILNEILDKKIAALIIVRLDGFDNCATELREKMKEMGELVGICGVIGCGKSAMLNAITGHKSTTYSIENNYLQIQPKLTKMSDELFELKEMVRKLEAKNAELMEKNDKLEEEIESLKAENSQLKNSAASNVAIQTSQPVKGEKPKSKRFFKNWLLFETLPWIDRKELANSSLCTSNETFQRLCWPKLHGNAKPHKIQYLRISRAHLELGNFRALVHLRTAGYSNSGRNEVIVPIASIPPLDYILGIDRIEINFVNDEVVNFLKSIANLLKNCELFKIMMTKKHIASVRTLMDCLADKIFILQWRHTELRLNDFNKIFTGFIDNIQFIQSWDRISSNDDKEIDTILNWLTKQPNNGKQKFLEIGQYDEKFISRINEEFSNSNSPSIFMINFWTEQNLEEFTQENVRTNEILALYCKNSCDNGWAVTNYYIVARYPKGEEEYWKEDRTNKIRETENSTSISINIDA